MLDLIACLLEPLLRLLWPASGQHRTRTAGPAPASVRRTTPTAGSPPPAGPKAAGHPASAAPREPVPPPDSDSRVRPYVLAHERRVREQRLQEQRARRRALWLAVHGVDVGPRLIHGVEVPA